MSRPNVWLEGVNAGKEAECLCVIGGGEEGSKSDSKCVANRVGAAVVRGWLLKGEELSWKPVVALRAWPRVDDPCEKGLSKEEDSGKGEWW